MRRRSTPLSEFPIAPSFVVACVVIIAIFWHFTDAPDSQSRSQGDFQILTGTQLVEDRANDGDSFRIQHRTQSETYRLYFVDTCEKSDRYPSRLGHQGRYFGGLSIPQVLKLGEEAREVTLDWLRHEPFEVHTRNESVMKSYRIHAMIRFPKAEGTDREWLSQRLVNAGLARIFTKGSHLADGTTAGSFKASLKRLESLAKNSRHGAWGLTK